MEVFQYPPGGQQYREFLVGQFAGLYELHRVELARPKAAIGQSTDAAVQSGVIYGYVGLVEGIVARFKAELGDEAKVIATGGWAELIAPETSVIDLVDPDLTLMGLRMIYELNR